MPNLKKTRKTKTSDHKWSEYFHSEIGRLKTELDRLKKNPGTGNESSTAMGLDQLEKGDPTHQQVCQFMVVGGGLSGDPKKKRFRSVRSFLLP